MRCPVTSRLQYEAEIDREIDLEIDLLADGLKESLDIDAVLDDARTADNV